MHYYKKNIGDYAKKTGRLSMLQHGAYTLLIDSCYDRERFPTMEEAIEWTWASSKEEIEAVEFILKRFFTLEDGRFIQARIQEEIENYHDKALKNKQIAIDREQKRKENNTNRERSVNETPPNHKPLTKNHKPLTNINTIAPEGVSPQVWDDFVAQRKKARAVISETVIKTIRKEADKAGWTLEQALAECAARGWRGFKAEWVKEKQTATDKNKEVLQGLTRGLIGGNKNVGLFSK